MVQLGAHVARGGEGVETRFALRSPHARDVDLCLFAGGTEQRVPMHRQGDLWRATLEGDLAGARYGYRARGEWAPTKGLWFDPAKLLVDPYAVELDRRFVYDPRLSEHGVDTAPIVPRAIVPGREPRGTHRPPVFARGGLIYELNVRGFTRTHPDVPDALRGTVAALAHPAIIAHFKKLSVSAIELMPITACCDERHLPPLGLHNFWGYNPVTMMALDPGLCPGGVAELRRTVDALHEAGIGVILDLVFNHTGESDELGPILSLRGLDNGAYAHERGGRLVNDTGCGNTLDFGNPHVRALTVASLCHFVEHAGVDGFRFDLAPVMARSPAFDPHAAIFAEIAAQPALADRVMIAEPWDIGPGGYQLGQFPAHWLEWNDRYRDDVRRFWRGDASIGDLATRLAGSSDIFGEQTCRSVNFLAAHDGFTLADLLAYDTRHNWANGEHNRDGHGDNHSWNNGVEGPSDDSAINARRSAYAHALIATLFASTGTIMLTAGDEFGRTQGGNNNAYCQDSPIGWVDWSHRDMVLENHVARLSAWRVARVARFAQFPMAGLWLNGDGHAMTTQDWERPGAGAVGYTSGTYRFAIDRDARRVVLGDDGGDAGCT